MSTNKKSQIAYEDFMRFVTTINKKIRATIESDDVGNLQVAELNSICEMGEDIVSSLLRPPQIFSRVKYTDISNVLGLSESLSMLPEWEPEIVQLPFEELEKIQSRLLSSSRSIGILSILDNEQKRRKFIDAFVDVILDLFKGLVINAIEETIFHKDSASGYQGRIEYILKVKSYNSIVVIIEAKNILNNMANYGQIISELFSVYKLNIMRDRGVDSVFGVLSDGEEWSWWRYDGTSIYRTAREQLREFDAESIPTIAGRLFNMILQGLCNSVSTRVGSAEIQLEDHCNRLRNLQDNIKRAQDHMEFNACMKDLKDYIIYSCGITTTDQNWVIKRKLINRVNN